MQSGTVDFESAAHSRRVAYLVQRAASFSSSDLFGLCNQFDEAAEFSALERTSIAAAISKLCGEEQVFGELVRVLGFATEPVDSRAIQLPVMPKYASRLLRTSDEDTCAAELEQITASDPVHAGKLLGAANSARFGSQFQIVSLRDAIMRLGIPESRRILLSSCLSTVFASKQLQDLWKHSEAVAGIARDLAQFANSDVDEAWVSGLLHDIGRLAFTKVPAQLRILEQELMAGGFPVVFAEALACGVDHAEFGAQCLRAWEIPASIVEAVAFHHRPECSDSRLASILCLAEDLIASSTNAVSEDLWSAMRRTESLLRTRLTLEQFHYFVSNRNSFRSTQSRLYGRDSISTECG